ncbi:MAG: hypothetical protein COV74_10320 [Candidatus Omnitrophica bacterium CG11_big_fil_rev_8_21_14_0_20_45_26]|uniref:Uncharacterized protein n=1 Tax=Candidatus Abzuiibacterium crystallinum TaxID=1974748 RepID=A0A2H0LKW5_9BACT|nr:MAG: hypothetical protein COV74_10320 [Candidatus Omnitrophica bacterium CG11_big_fil_rev_8_21_14_0_20_45_26]PIW63936.1 MAG: hypothetical protein COW12_08500 [Candidatus Omnitrophica bacterium CG12_big_fil_rev_8_21_14_0_65_45_16]
MDFNSEEQKIKDWFEKHPLKELPKEITKNYVAEVREKINAEAAGPHFGIQAFAFSFALVGALAVLFLLNHQFQQVMEMLQPQEVITTPVSSQVTLPPVVSTDANAEKRVSEPEVLDKPEPVILKQTESSQPAELDVNQVINSIADDIFILEMLGETEGLEDLLPANEDKFASELEFFGQIVPAI